MSIINPRSQTYRLEEEGKSCLNRLWLQKSIVNTRETVAMHNP